MNRQINCHTHTHTHSILFSHIKEFTICNNIDEFEEYYERWHKSEKDKYCMFSFICGILKIRQINAYNKTETYSDTENKLFLPVVRVVRGETWWGMGLRGMN